MPESSSKLLDLLSQHGLGSEQEAARKVASFARADLEALRADYQEWGKASSEKFSAAIQDSNRITIVPSVRMRQSPTLRWLPRAALYTDGVVIDDGMGILNSLEWGATLAYYQTEIPRTISRIARLGPLVRAGFVDFLPPPVQSSVPVGDLTETVPRIMKRPETQALIEANTQVVDYQSGYRQIQTGPYGMMSITVSGAPGSTQTVQILPPPTGPATIIPIDRALVDPQISKSIRQLSEMLVRNIAVDQRLAHHVGGWYLSPSGVEWDLLTLDNRTAGQSQEAKALAAVFELELPFVDNLPPDEILRVRAESPESFENFRTNLRLAASEVKALPGTEDFAHAVAEIRASRIDPLVSQLSVDAGVLRKQLRTKLAIDLPLVIGSSALAAFSPALLGSAAGTVIGSLTAVDLVKDVKETILQKQRLRTNPYHFIFRLQQESENRPGQ